MIMESCLLVMMEVHIFKIDTRQRTYSDDQVEHDGSFKLYYITVLLECFNCLVLG